MDFSALSRFGLIGVVFLTGCRSAQVPIPAGYLPPASAPADAGTVRSLGSATTEPLHPRPEEIPPQTLPKGPAERAPNKAEAPKTQPARVAFELPPGLPGADAPPIPPLRFEKDTPAEERDRRIRETYPALVPVGATEVIPSTGHPLTLLDLQRLAAGNSPVLVRARADVDAAYGAVIQAGLKPNPTIGWEAGQWQPGPKPNHSSGQQGAFMNLLIKFPAKLTLAQAVAGFDYLNAVVAVRRADVDVTSKVRDAYFNVLIARKGVEVNRALASLVDEVYRLQLKQLAAGEAAGYEPLQLYAQAVQARNALVRSETNYRASWKQLTSAVGRPDLPSAPLDGAADSPAPRFDPVQVQARMLEQHTDLLTGRNTLEQSRVNLRLQQITPVPDLQTYSNVGHDNASGNFQFQLQLGLPIPLFDRNQGSIRQAQAKIGRSVADLNATQNDLLARLASAFARYESNRAVAENYRERIIPNLNRAYRSLVRRYQVEPDKVGFNDIVVAQQNVAQALQDYLTALDGQWAALVELASLGQLDELYSEGPVEERVPVKP